MSGVGVPRDWTVHRRDDGEPLGWIRPAGPSWTAVDVLGREVAAEVEWLDAEDALAERGLAFLADRWVLEGADGGRYVRIVEVTPERIVVKADDFGDVVRAAERFELPWPLPDRLRPPTPDDPDPYVI